jgi:predicted cation transporter
MIPIGILRGILFVLTVFHCFVNRLLSVSVYPVLGEVMTHAGLSTEGLISTGLRSINCSHRDFAEIAACMNIPVSHSLISMCLRGEREFATSTGEKLLSLLQECLALRSHLQDAPLNWAATEGVSTLLVKRRCDLAGIDVDAAAASESD